MLKLSHEPKFDSFGFCHINLTVREKEVLTYCLAKPIFLDIALSNAFGSIQPKTIEGVGVTIGLIGQLEAKGLVKCHYLDDRFERNNIFSITEKGKFVAEQNNLQEKACA